MSGWLYSYGVALVIVLVSCDRCSFVYANEQLSIAVAGHTAALASIKTLKCNFTITNKSLSKAAIRGSYWFTPRATKEKTLSQSADGQWIDETVVDGDRALRLRYTVDSARREADLTIGRATSADRSFWLFANQTACCLDDNEDCTPSVLVSRSQSQRVTLLRGGGGQGGVECLLHFQKGRLTLLFDPSVNYLLRRVSYQADSQASVPQQVGNNYFAEVAEVIECNPGVFFPLRVVRRYSSGDPAGPQGQDEIQFSELQINQPIADAEVALTYPNQGVTVVDAVRGVMYDVDAHGRLVGRERSLAGTPTSLRASNQREVQVTHPAVTRSESSSWEVGFVIVGAIFLAAGLIIVILRKGRHGS